MTQQIRKAIAAEITALAKFNGVYSNNKNNLTESNLPAVIVTTGDGFFEDGAETVNLDVRIEIRDKGIKIEDILDDHAENYIEPLFPIGKTLNGLVEYMKPLSFSYILDADSDLGSMILNYNVKYDNEG